MVFRLIFFVERNERRGIRGGFPLEKWLQVQGGAPRGGTTEQTNTKCSCSNFYHIYWRKFNDSNYNQNIFLFLNDFTQELEEVFTFNTFYNAFIFKKWPINKNALKHKKFVSKLITDCISKMYHIKRRCWEKLKFGQISKVCCWKQILKILVHHQR